MATGNTIEGKPGAGGGIDSGAVLGGSASAPHFEALGVRLFRRDFASSYGWWGNLAVVIGRQPPDAEHVANYRECVIELHRQHPRGVGLITVVNDTSTPSAAGREATTFPLAS